MWTLTISYLPISISGKTQAVRVNHCALYFVLVVTLRQQLVNLNDLIRVVFVKTPKRYFKEMLNNLNQVLIDALLRYLMMLSSIGYQLGVQADYFFENPVLLAHDIQDLILFFCPIDRDGNELGLSRQECQENCESLVNFLHFMREDDQMLISFFKTCEVQHNREIISRILYRRQSSHVDKFFETYKSLFGGK